MSASRRRDAERSSPLMRNQVPYRCGTTFLMMRNLVPHDRPLMRNDVPHPPYLPLGEIYLSGLPNTPRRSAIGCAEGYGHVGAPGWP